MSIPLATQQLLSQRDILEAFQQGRQLKESEIERFISLGVEERSLFEPSPVLVSRVNFIKDGLFEFESEIGDGQSQTAFVLLVESSGDIIDIVAWDPRTGRIGSWLRRAFALGGDEIWQPHIGDDPLYVWRSPLGWLRAKRKGLVILRPEAAPFYGAYIPKIVAEDIEHGELLGKMFLPPRPTTEILVPAAPITRNKKEAA